MAQRRIFSKAFKRQIVEEMLSGRSTQAQLIRHHGLSYNMLSNWRNAFRDGRYGDESSTRVLEARIHELERKVGELTMDNDLLKRAAKFAALQEDGSGLLYSGPAVDPSDGGAS